MGDWQLAVSEQAKQATYVMSIALVEEHAITLQGYVAVIWAITATIVALLTTSPSNFVAVLFIQ